MPTVVQFSVQGNQTTYSFPSAVTAGNLLVVVTNDCTGTTLTDSRGTSYALAISHTGGQPVRMFYGIVPSSGTCTVTLTGMSGGNPVLVEVGFLEISGALAVLDGTPVGAAGSSGTSSPGSLTTSFANSIAICGLGGAHGGTAWLAPGGGWTYLYGGTSTISGIDDSIALAYLVEVTPGAVSPTFGASAGNSSSDSLVLAAFKAAPVPPPPPGPTAATAYGIPTSGMVLMVSNASSPETFEIIANVFSLKLPTSGEVVDLTEFGDLWRRRVPTLLDMGKIELKIYWEMEEITHRNAAAYGLRYLMLNLIKRDWLITYPDGHSSTDAFPAYVTGFEVDGSIGKVFEATVELSNSGVPSLV
jgi:hypothetical protein